MRWSFWFMILCLLVGFVVDGIIRLYMWETYIFILTPVGLAFVLGIPLRIAEKREYEKDLIIWAKNYCLFRKNLELFWKKFEQFPYKEE